MCHNVNFRGPGSGDRLSGSQSPDPLPLRMITMITMIPATQLDQLPIRVGLGQFQTPNDSLLAYIKQEYK